MKDIYYVLLVLMQLLSLAVIVSSQEAVSESATTSEPDLFSNISTSLSNIKNKIAKIKSYLPEAFPVTSSETAKVNQELDVDVSHYNGSYDSIMEKVAAIKVKVKELKNTLSSLNIILDGGLEKARNLKKSQEI